MKSTEMPVRQESWTLPGAAHVRLTCPASIMAIINATPDSFSDGGLHLDPEAVATFANEAVSAGARFLDIGGESTRPGSSPVDAEEECRRVVPVLDMLCEKILPAHKDVHVSIDTSKASVAATALGHGAQIVNDVSAGRDPEMFSVIADAAVPVVLMHMQGTPATMQQRPQYTDVLDDICAFFDERISAATAAGIDEDNIILDPGIGFGKTVEQNLQILGGLDIFHRRLNRPLLIGLSRKSFLPKVMGRELPAHERDQWSHLFHARIADRCEILRVHDVPGAVDAIRAAACLETRGDSDV